MSVIINPFDAGGYSLAEMTQAINILPNIYTRIGQMGLFRSEGVTQRSVLVERMTDGSFGLLPTAPLGSRPTQANRQSRDTRAFTIPWVPHNDAIVPQDIQGVRGFGIFDGADPLATIMERKLTRMRQKHAATLEYMQMTALVSGITKDGAGSTIFDWNAEFGLSQQQTDFLLGTAGTEVGTKCRAVLRWIETHLQGESMNGVLALVGPGFWDKLITHATVKDSYKFFANSGGAQPMREDMRVKGFYFHGITFMEYNATVTLSTGSTTTLVPDQGGVAFPIGTQDVFVNYFAPANLLETVNTIGLPLYARQIGRPDGSGIDIFTESSPLPMVKRPDLVVNLTTSN